MDDEVLEAGGTCRHLQRVSTALLLGGWGSGWGAIVTSPSSFVCCLPRRSIIRGVRIFVVFPEKFRENI